jgi:hypothetical protein
MAGTTLCCLLAAHVLANRDDCDCFLLKHRYMRVFVKQAVQAQMKELSTKVEAMPVPQSMRGSYTPAAAAAHGVGSMYPPARQPVPSDSRRRTDSPDDGVDNDNDSSAAVPQLAYELFSQLSVVVVVAELDIAVSCKPLVTEMELSIKSHGPLSLCFSSELGAATVLMEGGSKPAQPALECIVWNVRAALSHCLGSLCTRAEAASLSTFVSACAHLHCS